MVSVLSYVQPGEFFQVRSQARDLHGLRQPSRDSSGGTADGS